MKYALYVEGKAELLFVADILAKYSNYDSKVLGFQCINLTADEYQEIKYPSQGNLNDSLNFYQIVNVNNDNLVISKLKKDIPTLIKNGFEVIIGLRDVYGDSYKNLCKIQNIDSELIEKMYNVQLNQLVGNNDFKNVEINLHYAIMEFEAWMIALIDNFIISHGKKVEDVFSEIKIDYTCDFEKVIYHPLNKVQEIYRILELDYGKHETDYFSFLSSLTIDDYEKLRNSGKCNSFKLFIDSLLR